MNKFLKTFFLLPIYLTTIIMGAIGVPCTVIGWIAAIIGFTSGNKIIGIIFSILFLFGPSITYSGFKLASKIEDIITK